MFLDFSYRVQRTKRTCESFRAMTIIVGGELVSGPLEVFSTKVLLVGKGRGGDGTDDTDDDDDDKIGVESNVRVRASSDGQLATLRGGGYRRRN
mmetsp:Transcript_11229/g.12337  ORF Transcript_11229/g.12337 Transcript_11229/m.12337 type:complete len:94 (-) Transcript_11229:21-302(-)